MHTMPQIISFRWHLNSNAHRLNINPQSLLWWGRNNIPHTIPILMQVGDPNLKLLHGIWINPQYKTPITPSLKERIIVPNSDKEARTYRWALCRQACWAICKEIGKEPSRGTMTPHGTTHTNHWGISVVVRRVQKASKRNETLFKEN